MDRTQERRGSRQILAIERRRTRRARRTQFRSGPGAAQITHVGEAGTARLTENGWIEEEGHDGGTV